MLTHLDFNIIDLPETKEFKPFQAANPPPGSPFTNLKTWSRSPVISNDTIIVSYYKQEANSELPWHVDERCTTSLKYVVYGSAPIIFEDGSSYKYKCAIFDAGTRHMVPAGDDRLILKISLRDVKYEDVKDKYKYLIGDIKYKDLICLI